MLQFTCRPLLFLALLVGSGIAGAATIGPDAFGYTASDVPFLWEDVSTTGTRVLAGADDGTFGPVNLGFNFSFYGNNYTSVCMSSNGLLTFGGCNSQYSNVDIANLGIHSSGLVDLPTIAVLWDDWQFFQDGADAVYYFQVVGAAPSRRFIVQWNIAYGYSSSPQSVTFQAILYENGSAIKLQYKDTNSGDFRTAGGSATVAIRDFASQVSRRVLQWSVNTPVIVDGKAIEFLVPHVVPGLHGHHPDHPHHGQHGHIAGGGNPPHFPGHSPALTADPAEGLLGIDPLVVVGLNEDGTVNANGLATTLARKPGQAARRGAVVQIFGPAESLTGENLEVAVGDVLAEVLFNGPVPEQPGVRQILVRIPDGAPSGLDVPVVFRSGGKRIGRKAAVAIE